MAWWGVFFLFITGSPGFAIILMILILAFGD
jgi:hypothetical protein